MIPINLTAKERVLAGDYIASHTVLMDSGCMEWTAQLEDGYGRMHWPLDDPNKKVLVHRISYAVKHGSAPNAILDHECNNRKCANPDHLVPSNNRNNVLRGVGPTAVNARKTHCPKGHEFSKENLVPWAKGRTCWVCNREYHRAYAKEWKKRRVNV